MLIDASLGQQLAEEGEEEIKTTTCFFAVNFV